MPLHDRRTECLNYSASFHTLIEGLSQSEQLQKMPFPPMGENVPLFMRGYPQQYKVSPWPLIADPQFIEKMDALCRELPIALHKVLRFYAEQDPAYLAEYLGVSRVEVDLFASRLTQPEDLVLRYDAVQEAGQWRLIEVNSGASLGGWQHSWIYPEVLSLLDAWPQFRQFNIRFRNIVVELLLAYCHAARRLKGPQTAGNLLLFVPSSISAEFYQNLCEEFSALLEKIRPETMPSARLYYFQSVEQISFDPDGRLFFAGVEMDAVIMNTDSLDNLPKSFFNLLESMAQKAQFYYPDSLCYALLGNKLLFALVHESETASVLVPYQQELVRQCIPWTVRLGCPELVFAGSRYDTGAFIRSHQQQLVFKKAYSMQGKDVVVGASTPAGDWCRLYQQLATEPGWLIQQYVQPDPIPLAEPQHGFDFYRVIWGIFALQGRYAGCFLRATPDISGDTIINSARGATEFFLFEEQPQKHVIRF